VKRKPEIEMTYEEAKLTKERLEIESTQASRELSKYRRSESGMILDSEKLGESYQRDRAASLMAFEKLRQFNRIFLMQFKKEIKNDRAETLAKRLEKLNQENQN
jgi:hypothetical protein